MPEDTKPVIKGLCVLGNTFVGPMHKRTHLYAPLPRLEQGKVHKL